MPESGFYGVAVVGDAIGEGITGSRYATLDGVVKVADTAAPYTVANEYICGTLGIAVGLPVPPGIIAKLDDGTDGYSMMRFGPKGEKPPPAVAADLVRDRPRLSARIAVFDCWIINGDRHTKNFAYIPGEGVSVFDHGHALLGTTADGAMKHLEDWGSNPCWGGAIIPELQSPDDLFGAAEVIRSCHDELIREVCDFARRAGVLTGAESKRAADVLVERKKALSHYIENQQQAFPKITDWGLAS